MSLMLEPLQTPQPTLPPQLLLKRLAHNLRGASSGELPQLPQQLLHPGLLDVDGNSTFTG
jgi:hypothetical protein